jgi:hypothetical protein
MTQEMQAQFDAKRDKKIQDDKVCPTFALISCLVLSVMNLTSACVA